MAVAVWEQSQEYAQDCAASENHLNKGNWGDLAQLVSEPDSGSGFLVPYYRPKDRAVYYLTCEIPQDAEHSAAEESRNSVNVACKYIRDTRLAIEARREQDASFNQGVRPLILAVGYRINLPARELLRSAGAMVFDLALQCNRERFDSAGALVDRIEESQPKTDTIRLEDFKEPGSLDGGGGVRYPNPDDPGFDKELLKTLLTLDAPRP